MKRGIIRSILFASALAFTSAGCPVVNNTAGTYVPRAKAEHSKPYQLHDYGKNPVTKYAVIVVGSSRGEKGDDLRDPIDKNLFWLNATYNYKSLEELGFKHENIYFLYADGKPDFNETVNKDTIDRIKKNEFNEPIDKKEATVQNLEDIINVLSKKVDGNDIFVIAINTHGSPSSLEMHGFMFGSNLTPPTLNRMMKKIKPGFGLLYVDACYAGAYIKQLDLDDYVVISGTQENTNGWGDRDFSSSRYFFENLMDPESDANVDGKITVNESFARTTTESLAHMGRIGHYLLTRYNWSEDETANSLKNMSVVPMIRIGKNASGTFYFLDMMPYYRPK